MNPTTTQLRTLQEGSFRTRLDASPRKRIDIGEGWDRPCATEECLTTLNHFHEGLYCYACEDKLRREEVEDERLELVAEGAQT